MGRPSSTESVFHALSHPVRRKVLEQLARGEKSVTELHTDKTISRPTLSEHLRVLRATGLVSTRAKGASLIYRVNRGALLAGSSWLSDFARG